jgi:hypothetical protein
MEERFSASQSGRFIPGEIFLIKRHVILFAWYLVREKLILTQLVKKFLTLYETRRFITVFTRAFPIPSQVEPLPPTTRSTSALSSDMESGLFPSGRSTTVVCNALHNPTVSSSLI